MTRARTWSSNRSLEWAPRLGSSPPKRMIASWSGSDRGPTEYKGAARSFARNGGLPSVRCSPARFRHGRIGRYRPRSSNVFATAIKEDSQAGSTVLRRGKWWVLAMLVPPVKNGRPCAWLRSRRAKKARGAFAKPSAPCRSDGVGTRGVPTHRRNALTARRRTRGLVLEMLLTRLADVDTPASRIVQPYIVEARAESA